MTTNNANDTISKYKEAQQRLYEKEGVSPLSKFIYINGVFKNVHYIEVGTGNPLILIHGGGGSSDQWISLIKYLQFNYKLYIIDRPGCGLTDGCNYRGVDFKEHCESFINSFMNALSISSADFAANSMGGYWTAMFAMKYPDKVNKIVFLGAPAGLDLKLPFFIKLLGIRFINNFLWKTIAKPSIKGTKKLYEMLLVANANKLSDEFIHCGYLSSILPYYKLGWLTMLENITTISGFRKNYLIGNDMHLIKSPTLFLWGDKDAFQSNIEGKKISEKIKSSQFISIKDAGHLPWLDQPDFCATEIIKFLS
jgi:pimeloyl-ACP methyl ester carboxylesterase